MFKTFKFILLNISILLFVNSLYSQVTLYSEDFSTYIGKGRNGGTTDTTACGPQWNYNVNNGSFSSGDWFKVVTTNGGEFESHDCDGTASSTVNWLTRNVNITGYTNVTVSVDLGNYYSSSSSGVKAYYKIDAGAWTLFGSRAGNHADGWQTDTQAGLSGSNIQIAVTHYGTQSTPYYKHDNVKIEGTISCSANPTITTTAAASSITETTASSGGSTLTAGTGGCTVSNKGVCWNTSTNPTIANSKTDDGTGTADFTSSITGLTASTTYYVRAYVTNSFGTTYANEISFTTAAPCTPPTTQASSMTFSTVDCTTMTVEWTRGNGDGLIVLARAGGSPSDDPANGFSYTASATYGSGDVIGDGFVVYSGTGTSVDMTGLTQSTTYHFDVFEYNNTGICYNSIELTNSQLTASCTPTFYINDNSLSGDIYTTAVGNDANTGGTSDPFATITAAISAASNGEIIYIDAGTYNNWENITLTKELSFLGAGIDVTVIDDQFAGAATNFFMLVNADNVTFKDMTFSGYENNGTQIGRAQVLTIGNGSTGILIEDVSFQDNGQSGGNPSLVFLANSSSTVIGGGTMCNVWKTMYTGGIEVYGNNVTLSVSNYMFAFNFKTNSYDGGALLINNTNSATTVTINNCNFFNNEASDGGAISHHNGTLNVTDCNFEQNYAGQVGAVPACFGGAIVQKGGTSTYTNCSFVNNQSNGDGTLRGGAIALYSSVDVATMNLIDCYFDGNNGTNGTDVHEDEAFGTNINFSAENTKFQASTYSIYNKDANTVQLTDCGSPTVYGSVNTVTTTAASAFTPPITPGIASGDCGTGIILPIELNSFDGVCENGKVKLLWSTASEVNNSHFIVERAEDGENFKAIGHVEGSAYSSIILNYDFVDNKPLDGGSYYRLVQVDFDGKTRYTNVIFVKTNCDNSGDIEQVFYNELSNEIVINFFNNKDEDYNLSLYDISGKLILTESISANAYENQVSVKVSKELSSSIYLVNIRSNNETYNSKLIINNK